MRYETVKRIKDKIENTKATDAILRTLYLLLRFGSKQIEYNPLSENGLRWIENASKGMRLCGFADDLIRLDHRGWYTDPEGFEDGVMRGVVYQLPTRNGSPVFAVGYADPYNDDCCCVEIRTDIEDKEEAARIADSIAERCAEREREYQEAWQLGRRYADALEEIENERETRHNLRRYQIANPNDAAKHPGGV